MKKLVFFLVFLLLTSFACAQYESRGPGGPVSAALEENAANLGRTVQNMSGTPLFYIVSIFSILWIAAIRKKQKIEKSEGLFGIALLIGWIFLVGYGVGPSEPIIDKQWQMKYNEARTAAGIPDTYITETDYFDVSSPVIALITTKIRTNAYDVNDAVQRALDYIYYNVDYNKDESDGTCFGATGSKVIEKKSGQCDTQSIALVTLLRGLSIAARPVGGCYTTSAFCDLKYAIYAFFGYDLRKPKNQPITINDSIDWVGRREDTTGRGQYLHAWVEVWLPEKGWVIAETTAGRLMIGSCLQYHVEIYPERIKEMCVSTNVTYARACLNDDYETLGAI